MATSIAEDQVYVEANSSPLAIEVTSNSYVALGHEERVLISGQPTDLFSLTLEPRSDIALVEGAGSFPVTVATTTLLVEVGVGPQGPVGPQGLDGLMGPAGPQGADGSASFLIQQLPIEPADQIRTSFTAPGAFIPGSLSVTLNGLENPVVEVGPNSFTFSDPPHASDLILLRYQTA